jgi:hypothetical protein
MKTIYVILAGVLVSTLAIAREPGDGSKSTGLAVVKKNETTFNLFYKSAGLSNVKVSILNANGKEVFTEVIKKTDGFSRPYNLRKHPEGDYTIVVEDSQGKQTGNFILGGVERPKAAHIIKLDDHRYMLSMPNNINPGKVTIKIYDGSELVHEQAKEISDGFSQVFNIKNINEAVTFEVTDSKGNKIN